MPNEPRRIARAVTLLVTATCAPLAAARDAGTPPARPDVLQRASLRIPDLIEDLRYAADDNFLHRAVYPKGSVCWLHRDTLDRLERAAKALRAKGYRLLVYDCYRPRSVQWEMWKILPRPGYVADPRKGSNHNRGTAVDLTLADENGRAVEMPTPFDTFSPAAHHGYAKASKAAIAHREILREAMEAAGFRKNRMEWWHYDVPGATRYPILDAPLLP
ncbi:MAG: D-alanyl-D-alanine dipeptidase [Myxococcaceae bacterium]|nr:D-alanyl-D-alanine dipeptidase [Myxococcaceae bacterium]